MKKLLGIAALCMAFSPLAQAQGLAGHPDARNDRSPSEYTEQKASKPAKAKHKVKKTAKRAKAKVEKAVDPAR